MTVPPVPASEPIEQGLPQQDNSDRKRRTLLLVLMLLLLLLCCVGYFFLRYLAQPQPVTDMLPLVNQVVNYPPAYKMSFPGVDKPVGIALSPDGERIYVAESGGDRLVKVFDRDGNQLLSFAPPGTNPSNRKPTYIAVDASGRVFVSEIFNGVINVFDADGKFLDAIVDQDMTLSKYVAAQIKAPVAASALLFYDNTNRRVIYQPEGKPAQNFEAPARKEWAPLGVRFAANGDFLVTNLVGGKHEVVIFPAANMAQPLSEFAPAVRMFGLEGTDNGQLSYPNSVAADSKGNYYVSDGNNARISAWGADLQYRTFFGFGSTESSLNLPRGVWLNKKDHLHVVDAVGAMVRVYDVSQAEPVFLYSFGKLGLSEGDFNYPNDICEDANGTLFIADRENNRVSIWSY